MLRLTGVTGFVTPKKTAFDVPPARRRIDNGNSRRAGDSDGGTGDCRRQLSMVDQGGRKRGAIPLNDRSITEAKSIDG